MARVMFPDGGVFDTKEARQLWARDNALPPMAEGFERTALYAMHREAGPSLFKVTTTTRAKTEKERADEHAAMGTVAHVKEFLTATRQEEAVELLAFADAVELLRSYKADPGCIAEFAPHKIFHFDLACGCIGKVAGPESAVSVDAWISSQRMVEGGSTLIDDHAIRRIFEATGIFPARIQQFYPRLYALLDSNHRAVRHVVVWDEGLEPLD